VAVQLATFDEDHSPIQPHSGGGALGGSFAPPAGNREFLSAANSFQRWTRRSLQSERQLSVSFEPARDRN
jgi:hypothetical protein